MDDFGSSSFSSNDDLSKPIPLDGDLDMPIPLDDNPAGDSPGVSRAPLNLGGGGGSPAPAPPPKPQAPRPAEKKPVQTADPGERITGCRTFFTKLHAGAIDFLDGQISSWLKDNPGIVVRRTNVTTGEVQGKKTEPNILITVWY